MRYSTLAIWLATAVVSSAQQIAFQDTQDVLHTEQGMSLLVSREDEADHSSKFQ
jgi:predicted lipoprotein with Yx(FWY)xxD motif